MTIEDKYWKISPADLKERQYWDDYTAAYEDLLSETGHDHAPWIVVPANDKKIARAIVAHVIADAINGLDIDFPKLSSAEIAELKQSKLIWKKKKLNYTIIALNALKDNYIWLIHDGQNAVAVDPTESHVVEQYLQQHNLSLKVILLTHNHPDHTGGVKALCERYAPTCIDNFVQQLADGQMLNLADLDLSVKVLLTPGIR